ncbi:hypothetical protein CkaCkLH20_01947 [Colletotrichum karsti]|uniref:NWD NACHT-NTPase N-terminal domain-containing protein n=1 Tax=Colletotrichum karsti TaxID=1095194 RepID=A0A9P6LPI1_9PEZI|nr:uncharacterized protein CkaCkLH20_01947 [Colletotrichum karsti]KAF9880905.1 hypothetical protein CkaCkLH20_01947 [Colletotrichum karsti]
MAGKRFKALLRGTFKRDHDKPSANSSPASSRSSTPVQAAADHGSAQSVTTGQDTQSTTVQQCSQLVSIDQDTQPGTAGQDAPSLSHAPMPEPNDAMPSVIASDHAQDLVTTTPVDVTPEDEAAAAAQSLDDPNSLWKAAYRLLQEREPDLAAAYADHLLPGSTADTLTSSDSVASVVEGLQAEREAKQWKFEVRGRSVKVRGQIEKLAKFLVWTDGVVKTAVSAQPCAALAWSAISIFIPLLTVGTDLNEAMLEGLESVTRVQVFWKMYETSASTETNSKDFVDLVTNLYSMIIEYQARVVCHLSLRQRSRAWVNVIDGTAWEGKAENVNRVDQQCRIYLDQTQKQNAEEKWETQISEILKSREILEHIHAALVTTRQQYEDETEQSILERLFADHEGYKNDFNPTRTKGTCEWFFQDPRFLRWRDSNQSSLLWVSAGPGCGKSVLSRALIDEHWLPTTASTSTVCYFFFKDGYERRTTCAAALSAILHQIFVQDESGELIKKAKAAYKNAGQHFGTAHQPLWDILLDCVGSENIGDVVCLIDALDECETHERTKFVDLLKRFYGDGPRSSILNLRFIVTSRPYDTIEYLFETLSSAVDSRSAYVRFDGSDKSDDINREIDLVIDEKVVEVLLEHDANPSILSGPTGESALDEAVRGGHRAIAKLLLSHKKGIPVRRETYESLMSSGSRKATFLKLLMKNDPDMEITTKMLAKAVSPKREGLNQSFDMLSFLVEKGKSLPVSWNTLETVMSDPQLYNTNLVVLLLDQLEVNDILPSEDLFVSADTNPVCGHDILKALLDRFRDFEPSERVFVHAAGNSGEHGDEILKLLFEHCPEIRITEAVARSAVYSAKLVSDVFITAAERRDIRTTRRILELLFEKSPAATVAESVMWYALDNCSPTIDFFIEKQADFEILKRFIGNILNTRPYSGPNEQSDALELNCSEQLLALLLEEHRDSLLVRELIAAQLAKMAVGNRNQDVDNFDILFAHLYGVRGGPKISVEALREWFGLFTAAEYVPLTYRVLNCMQYYANSERDVEHALSVFFEAPTVRVLATVPDGEARREMTKEDARELIRELQDRDPRRDRLGRKTDYFTESRGLRKLEMFDPRLGSAEALELPNLSHIGERQEQMSAVLKSFHNFLATQSALHTSSQGHF